MKPIHIVGAGFAGLTLAYHLKKRGLEVAVFEKQGRAGGLLASSMGAHGLIEEAANAVLADADIEALFRDLNVPFAGIKPIRKNRYIFWSKPRRWTLGPLASAKVLGFCSNGNSIAKAFAQN